MSATQEIGAIIKAKRIKEKLTQKQLSMKIYQSVEHHALISRVENGVRDNVRFDTIYIILEALGIELISTIKNR